LLCCRREAIHGIMERHQTLLLVFEPRLQFRRNIEIAELQGSEDGDDHRQKSDADYRP